MVENNHHQYSNNNHHHNSTTTDASFSDQQSYSTSATTSIHELSESRPAAIHPPPPPPTELRRRTSSGKSNKKKRRRWRWIVGKPRDLTPEQEQVFMTMKLRKLNRALTGTKTKRTRFELFALVAYFVLAFGVVSYSSQGTNWEREENEDGTTRRIIVLDLTDIVVMMIYILVVSFVTSMFRESRYITLLYWMCIYLPLAAMIVSFLLDDHGDVSGFMGQNPVVIVLLITAEMTVLVVFLTLYKIYPKVVMSEWFRRKSRAGIFWRIKVISDWTMTYVGSWGRRFTCKYDGETNEFGLPHGFGRWLDDSYAGEVLTGNWINGIPVAPFASRQFGTGDAFKAVRIGYLMASDDEFTTTKFWPTNEKPPRIGICSVECSISGSFYNELPLATHLAGPHWLDDSHNVSKLCRQLTHVDDEEERVHQIVQIKASDPRGVQVRGHVYKHTGESFHAGCESVVIHVENKDGDSSNPSLSCPEEQASNSKRKKKTPRRRSLNFMPRASRHTFVSERIIVCNESDSGDESERPVELTTVVEEDSQVDHSHSMQPANDDDDDDDNVPDHDNPLQEQFSDDGSMVVKESPVPAPAPPTTTTAVPTGISRILPVTAATLLRGMPTLARSNSGLSNASSRSGSRATATTNSAHYASGHSLPFDTMEMGMGGSGGMMSERSTLEPFRMANATLSIEDWIPAPHKDALIFFPGYKVPLKQSLEALGQFIAMTRLDLRVYPIIFGWPNGQRFSYLAASQCASTEVNRENFVSLVKGLQDAGIRNVHFMTHSMGVQTLLGGFADREDGTASELAQLFQLDPDYMDAEQQDAGDDSHHHHRTSHGDSKLMICRTVTMLNPDFPLEAFVDRAFRSVRRLCGTITIIGDRHDKALLLSQTMNGLIVYGGYRQPEVLQPKPNRYLETLSEREVYQGKHRMLQQVIGLSIESLYFPPDVDRDTLNDALLFKERAPVIVCTDYTEEDETVVGDRAWLDVDVIDTTGLDTNIAGIRHSGFNLNPILLKDLEELISTGRRAVNRATLLYREGNNFSYCHAPSYVAM